MSAFRTINWSQTTSVGSHIGPLGLRERPSGAGEVISHASRDALRQQADLRCSEQARRITELLRQKEERERLTVAAEQGAVRRRLDFERHAAMAAAMSGSRGDLSAAAA